MSVSLKKIHHVAYRCHDAKETVEFYQRVLNMDFQFVIMRKMKSLPQKNPIPTCMYSSTLAWEMYSHFLNCPTPQRWAEMIKPRFGYSISLLKSTQ